MNDFNEFTDKIICPICGFNYTHFTSTEYIKAEDNCLAWEGKGNAIVITFYCEEDHCWKLILGHHKGESFIFCKQTPKIIPFVTKKINGKKQS